MSKRLLVLDEDHFSRVMLALVLRAQGYDVLDVASGADALKVAESRPVDLALVALTAGAPDGLDVIARLQSLRRTPAIALTNGADSAQTRAARRYGTIAQIEKPTDIKGLLALIDRALGAAPV